VLGEAIRQSVRAEHNSKEKEKGNVATAAIPSFGCRKKKEEERKQKQKQKTTQAKFKSGTKKCGLESSESIKPVRRLLAAI